LLRVLQVVLKVTRNSTPWRVIWDRESWVTKTVWLSCKTCFCSPTSKGYPIIDANGARGHGSDELFHRKCS